ncbi:MAG: hypothetical protein OQK82_03215 [Candidatus Pacearchaeota archaeon]|nr:hypothetical protein [Candidatus Pacearchaeota archaeon]
MPDIFLQIGTNLTVNPNLGFSLLGFNVGVTHVTQDIVIQAEKQFLYYNNRLLSALNSGVISQSVYDIITINQGEARQIYEINNNLDINKQSLIDLVEENYIQNVEIGGTAAQIIEDIINEGYQIIKKI